MSEVAEAVKTESAFSKKNRRLLVDPLNDTNPITVQILGICSALAVTSSVMNSLVMGIGVTLVTAMSNFVISSMRNHIPNRIRMIVQLVVIAWLVTMVAMFLQAYLYDTYKQLSVFVGLIITNCIVMGRLEAYAMANKPWPSLLDGIGNGLGYTVILLGIGTIREIFGAGKFLGFQVIPDGVYSFGYANNGLMVLPISSIILIGVFIWIQRSWNKKLVDVS
ncbi:NADH:ubiquinone reductase (Na(+)-transporting) subunit D [soil metagenome]